MLSERQSAALFAESKRCVDRNRVLLAESWRRVACSRRRLNPWFAVSGGSEPSERTLRATVRALLASGLRSPIDGNVLANSGTGKQCAVCGTPVTPAQPQVEPNGGQAVESVAHVPCFLAWYDESNAVHGEEPSEGSHGQGSLA
jgi:hypothetical protein